MKFAFFIGCNIPARLQQYELSSRAVLRRLGVDLIDIREFNCCGYPIRNIDFNTYILFSARNLALAEQRELDMITLCKCCFGSLKKANHLLKENKSLRDEVNSILAKEGLSYSGGSKVTHFLSVLHKDIGTENIKKKLKLLFKDLNIATHYGCHALRPSEITQFDDPVAPVIFDDLVKVTGAKSLDWPLKLECCGAPAMGINDSLSMTLTEKKQTDAKDAGADYLCSACPWCQLQFDHAQKANGSKPDKGNQIPSILYTQLLGLSMGIADKLLGFEMNAIDMSEIKKSLTPASSPKKKARGKSRKT
ncbi:MAG: disulfide reductase [Desulfobacterales bacterium]|nr:disulfide reductase [Desulfobacterales bacterium]